MKAVPARLRAFVERSRTSAWTLPVAAVLALGMVFVNEATWRQSSASLDQLEAHARTRSHIEQLRRSLLDAETAQRGFLLTDRPEYLNPYRQATAAARAARAWLEQRYRGDAEVAPLLDEIRAHSTTKLSELDTTLTLYAEGRHEAWRALLLTDIGRERMEGLLAASERLSRVEASRVEAEREHIVSTLDRARVGIHLFTVLGLAGLAALMRQNLAFDRSQRRHAAELAAERDRLEEEVARRTGDLTELARHLQSAREDEKSRLAHELHDELGALLTAAKLDAARLKRLFGAVRSPEIEARLAHLNESINRGIELKRRIIEDLHPSSLANLGLAAALEILAREHAAAAEVQVNTELLGAARAENLPEGVQLTIFRLVQEALTNAAKHAQARRITIRLAVERGAASPRADAAAGLDEADRVHIAVRDDGRGFDPARRRGSTHGLMGMRYRVEAEGGQMRVASAPGQGASIEAWLPLATGGREAAGEAEAPRQAARLPREARPDGRPDIVRREAARPVAGIG